MWQDLALLVVFGLMILAPCFMATGAGEWGTEEDGGYERGASLPFFKHRRSKALAAATR